MNRIFKIVYNFSLQQFVVVSELSKSKGKSNHKMDKRIKPESLLSLSVAGGLLLAGDVFAANLVSSNQFYAETDSTNSFIAVGQTATKQSEGSGVVIGTNVAINRQNAVAIGQNATVGMKSTTDGGWQLLGSETTAIGSNVTASLNNTVVIGSNIIVARPEFESATTIDHLTESVAVGTNLNTSSGHVTMMGANISAPGQYSIGIGNDIFVAATTVQRSRTHSVLMGFNLNSTDTKTYSIGSNIAASGSDMISMGADIVNKAPTRGIAIGDKVNITSLSSYVVAVGSEAKAFGGGAIAVGRASIARDASKNLIAMGTSASAGGGEGAMALGFSANATAKGAMALGRKSIANGANTIAIGSESNVTGINSVALGADISVSTAGSVVLGNASSSTVAETVSDANVGSYTYSADRFAGKDFSNRDGAYVSVGSATNPRQIKFVGAGKIDKTSTDAINGSQLYAVMERVETGWNITTSKSGNGDVSGTIDDNIGLAEILTVDASNNINITQSANKISIATSTKPTFETVNVTNSLNVGDIVMNASGLNMDSKPITNLKAGVADTDAVNVSQLKQARSAVVAGSNTVVATQANATSGGTDYIVHTFNTTATGSDQIKVTPTFDSTTNTTNYAIDLSDSAKTNITTANEIANAANNTANAGWKLNTTSSGNGQVSGSTDETINMNETVTLDAGNNINITQAQNKITIATSTKPTFETVNVTNSLNVGDIVVDKDSGINMANKPITNLTAGTNDTDAVNVSQLKQARSAVLAGSNTVVSTQANATSGGTDYIVHAFNTTATGSDQIKVTPTFDSTTNTTNYAIDLSDSAKANITTANNIATAANNTANAGWKLNTTSSGNGQVSGSSDETINMNETVTLDAGNNINITQAQNKITIATSTKPTFETVNVTTRLNVGDIVVDASGINMSNKPITNLTAGTNDTDAVNVSQLKQARSAVLAGSNTVVSTQANATSGGTDYIVHTFNTTATGSDQIKVTPTFDSTTNTTNYAIDLSDSAKTNITTANDIANAANNTANAGWKLNTTSSGNGQVSGSSDETINMNETVTLDAGNNINITQAQNKITIATSTKPTFETVNVTTRLNVGDIVVDASGINMANKPITNLQAGVADTDAVNVSQLKQARSAVVAGSNTVVATQANATSGGTDYIVHAFNTTATGSDDIKVTPTFDTATNTTTYAIDLSDSAKANITTANEIANAANNTANAGWKLNTTSSGNGQVSGSTDETINMNETVTLDAGNNINITQAQNKITIATSTKPTFETVNVTNSLNVGDIVVDTSGINMANKPITNLQAGTNDTDAVNVSQLKQARSAVVAGSNTVVSTQANATSGGTDYIVHAFNTTATGSDDIKVTPTFDTATNTTTYAIDLSDSAKANITTANDIATAANNTANAGWKLNTTSSGNGQVTDSSDETINMNETVTLDAGNNINITQAQNKITIATSTKPTFETVNVTTRLNVGDILVDASGINMANKPITNLTAGTNDTDAVNVSQLKQARSAVVAGSNTVVATQVNATSGGTDYIVHTFNTTATGSDDIKVTPTFDTATNTTTYAIDLSDSAKANITTANDIATAANNTANAGWKLNTTSSGNGQVSGSSDETINMNETVTLDAGNNINITQAQNKITIATSTKPTFETVNVTTRLNVGDIVVDASGINMANKPITNLKAGEADTDAVNVSQLKNASSNMIATGLNFAGDNNVTVHRDLGQTLKIEGGATSNLTYGNIGVVEDPANGSLSVRLAEKLNLGSNGTITMGNTTLADNQIKVGEQTRIGNGTATIGDITIADGKLTGLKDGKISADSTEAINGSQLYNVVNNISNVAGDVAKGWNLNTSASGGFVENSSLEQIKMGETVTIDAGKNVNITQAGNTVSIAVSNNPTFENVTTDNLIFAGNPNAKLSYAGDGFNLNGNKLTNVANGTNATDAVNVQQLNNAGWTVAGNGSSVSKVVNNNVVSFDNGSGTTARVAKNNDGSTSVSYDVNRSPIITNSEGKLVAGNKSGFATADDIANAINQSGWKVQSTATAGTTGKVVNLDSNGNQMARQSATKVSVGSTVNINAGNNVVVTRQGRNIEVATSMTPTFNTVSVGNGEVTIGASKDTDGVSQVTLAGKDGKSAVRVTNIATGKADTDAVNVGQLRNTARALTNNINAVNDRVTKVDRRLRAGVAGALAVGNLPQVHTNGKSQLAAGVGSYRGQNALAVGYSRLSDNGKVILKVSGNADTRGDVGGAASIGFEW